MKLKIKDFRTISNIVIALFFTIAHLGVTYTSDSSTFFVIVLILGLAWGYIIQRTDSLLAAILFHAGAYVVLVIGFFSNM
ncbi:MAG: CPBP family intramembrane metalloprotease [Methanosarcinales archaeon]|nr:CPBP family intramembrane metalloprotease [Methanosarcinales archaeon]MCD4797903.1 CPBP family intramembrane metalloprotease [Methanosarcinales archaeon]MCD4809211.1 CPBP family intramembrane metalloprotease [Methanosarcinales archaeon]